MIQKKSYSNTAKAKVGASLLKINSNCLHGTGFSSKVVHLYFCTCSQNNEKLSSVCHTVAAGDVSSGCCQTHWNVKLIVIDKQQHSVTTIKYFLSFETLMSTSAVNVVSHSRLHNYKSLKTAGDFSVISHPLTVIGSDAAATRQWRIPLGVIDRSIHRPPLVFSQAWYSRCERLAWGAISPSRLSHACHKSPSPPAGFFPSIQPISNK